ncbi:MAG: exodeoxyribonuclease VII large subunit, partial [Gemmatimonadota bacterium]|nr:exodeoxyribonuclease VII large subunit [Gemmatimonadota bacterium]
MTGRRRTSEESPASLDLFGAGAGRSARYAVGNERHTFAAEPTLLPESFPGSAPGCALAVDDLNNYAKEILEGAFTPMWVRGEVSDFKAHRNGHWYFCLRDATSSIKCVVWSRDRTRIVAPPDDGMQVVARGRLTVYPARGEMQLVINALDAVGDGLHRKALDLARELLAAEGLLDPARKRRLPRLPRCVAVVTSPSGAALHDIVSVVQRRCPSVMVVLVPAKVQGEGAPAEIAAAIQRVIRWGCADVLIVGRGGGAREDLWAFNDPRVARALAHAPMPTISAVGHEIDVTLCDLVADVRAATPSAAAECAVPSLAEERAMLGALESTMRRRLTRRLDSARERAGYA